jgi:NitT/TauT family transport system substrate-binding protein
MKIVQNRRGFLATLSLAGAASLIGARTSFAEEPAPETTVIRLSKIPALCLAPQYIVESLLRAEGFTDVRYVEISDTDDALQGDIARVPSEDWLEFAVARSPGNMKVSDQAARLIG